MRTGRPPIGRKAMTGAERQARRRKKLADAEAARVKARALRKASGRLRHGSIKN
jgi:hypothetical protein